MPDDVFPCGKPDKKRLRFVWKGDYEDGLAVGIIVTTLARMIWDLTGWSIV